MGGGGLMGPLDSGSSRGLGLLLRYPRLNTGVSLETTTSQIHPAPRVTRLVQFVILHVIRVVETRGVGTLS